MPRTPKKMLIQHIGKRLKEMRTNAGISQTALGKELDVTGQQVQKYESGENRLPVELMWDSCPILNVTIPDFFYGLPEELKKEYPDADKYLIPTLPYPSQVLSPEQAGKALANIEDPLVRKLMILLSQRLSDTSTNPE